ncbi:MAG: molybdopterin biosynthesis protein, partial [Bacillota bacterium]|nr:molybdopterin biosynthesis protein [Bacillota bacterium]
YLNNVSVEEAKEKWYKNFELFTEIETIDIRDAVGRIVAKELIAINSTPHYHASAVDGIAVKSQDTQGASDINPKKLIINRDFEYVDTGDQVKDGYNAVIMIEDLNEVEDGNVEIEKSITPWANVRNIGESLVKGQLILSKFQEINSYAIGQVLETGLIKVEVFKKPLVEFIPTGTELLEAGSKLEAGKLIEYNSHILSSLATTWGADIYRNEIVDDDYNIIKEKIIKASQRSDFIVVLSGSSAGSEDYTSHIIEELGEVYVHGVSIKPGGPVILGKVNNKPVIGVPGYPVAAALNFRLFGRKIIYNLKGQSEPVDTIVKAKVKTKIISKLGFREFVRVKLTMMDNELVIIPLKRASGVIGTMVEADGFLIISEFSEGINRNEIVDVTLIRNSNDYNNTLFLNGSNDIILDIVKNQLAEKGVNFITKSTGSLAGITSLQRGEAHISTSHLLNPENGEYNFSYIEKYLKNEDVELINIAYRQQGMIVQKNNLKNIKSIKDLESDDIIFINRQRGSGTRVLFDYKLKENNITSDKINGYNREEFTHMTLASEINSGSTDVGIGIQSAANAFDLDFIPIAKERYDLVILKKYLKDERIIKLLEVIRSDKFKNEVNKLKGYDLKFTGKVMRREDIKG